MMTTKQWILTFFTVVSCLTLPVIVFNYWMDPLWCFGHQTPFNQVQYGFDDRLLKTNEIAFQPFDYNTLMIGSSKTAYINQHNFKGYKAFNYGTNGLLLYEFFDYIEYAKAKNGKPFDVIIMGIDFPANDKTNPNHLASSEYFSRSQSFLYPYKSLLSWDTLGYSWRNFQNNFRDKQRLDRIFDRSNVRYPTRRNPKEVMKMVSNQLGKHFNKHYTGDYKHLNDYKQELLRIKKANPGTRFIVFTTPASEPLYRKLIMTGQWPTYERWLSDLVDVYGSVHHFMTLNTVAQNYTVYFNDAGHFYPEVGVWISQRLMNENNKQIPPDFGTPVTPANLSTFLKQERIQLDKCNKERCF